MVDYVAIKDMSAGNDSVGEQWQECKVFNKNTTLEEVMTWAVQYTGVPSKKHVQIIIAHE